MSVVFLSLGSNLGDSKQILEQAIEELKKIGTVVAVSSFYKTEPVGLKDQPWFLNCVVKIETEFEPLTLLHETQKIENIFWRERNIHWGPRTLDMDILFYDDLILNSTELILPHPRLHERKFVLQPLCEIDAQKIHPLFLQTLETLLHTTIDTASIFKI